jgi:hypothetical protein
MADYYSILAKAVWGLDPNTAAARRRLYGRARAALLAEVRGAYPPLDQSAIMAARKVLEEAIINVETQARREQRVDQEPTDALSLPLPHQQPRERIAPYPTLGPKMADYYSLVDKAINALGPHTEEARRQVYNRARAALLSEVHKLVPALDRSEVMAEQLHLELAIGEVEQREQSARSTAGAPVTDEDDVERTRNTWLTELLARASREENDDYRTFAPKPGLRRNGKARPYNRASYAGAQNDSNVDAPNLRRSRS